MEHIIINVNDILPNTLETVQNMDTQMHFSFNSLMEVGPKLKLLNSFYFYYLEMVEQVSEMFRNMPTGLQ